MQFTKSVVEPIKQVAPMTVIKGFIEDYRNVTADIIFLEGEIHIDRRPVSRSGFST